MSPPTERVVAALRESLKETDRLRRQNRRLLAANREPLAIVGMSCRLPGEVASPRDYWELLEAEVDAISGFPSDRGWDLPGLYEPALEAAHSGRSYVREGGFLKDAAEFDAEFFRISPREALVTDPQQRLLLEAAWEAVEDAGLDPLSLRGSKTGVFAGAMYQDYGLGLQSYVGVRREGQDMQEPNVLVGSTNSVITGRVAYALGLEGPAVTVDTACSSSLVSLHLACQSLRTGECSLALAGGVTVLSTPGVFIEFSRQRGLAPDSRCKAFADDADGTSVSEGVGLVVLERLSDARENGHPVLAVVRGSAINQDGASNGLTAPNGLAQRRVIRQALASAGLEASAIDAVEAHGTGTILGDPIEARALIAAYGTDRRRGHPLWLGSVKSNIGHTQAAAGVAGVIKMVMAIRNGLLPRSLHVERPSSKVEWVDGGVSLLTEALAWPRSDEPRRAAVSSFGISGTNAHLILEEATPERFASSPTISPPSAQRQIGIDDDGLGSEFSQANPLLESHAASDLQSSGNGGTHRQVVEAPLDLDAFPWILSGRGIDGFQAQAQRLDEFVGVEPGLMPVDIGASLAERPRFDQRGVAIGLDRDELLEGVRAFVTGVSRPGAIRGALPVAGSGGTVFVFPGQGSQWPGMALELMHRSTVFARRVRECDAALAPFLDWSLEGLLSGAEDAPELERVDVVQPALFAVMVALADVWQACGVAADAVVGHSQGEIAAACVAGALSLQDAARLIALRARALTALAGRGGMVSIAAGEAEVRGRIESFHDRISIAAVNGPGAVVVSGEVKALEELLADCAADNLRARAIPVDYAAHSAQVQEIREALLDGCAGIAPRSSNVPFYSSVSGGLVDTASLEADYWYRNLRDTVEFDRATRALLDGGLRMFIEISPHPVVTVGAQETVDALVGELRESLDSVEALDGVEVARSTDGAFSVDGSRPTSADITTSESQLEEIHDLENVTILGSLRREDGGPRRMLSSLSEAWVRGAPVDWKAVLAVGDARRVKLPTYAFRRRPYWLESLSGLSAAEQPTVLPRPSASLWHVDWVSVSLPAQSEISSWVAVGEQAHELIAAMCEADPSGESTRAYSDLSELGEQLGGALRCPRRVLVAYGLDCSSAAGAQLPRDGEESQQDLPGSVRQTMHSALQTVQSWIADERFADSHLVVLTQAAVAARSDEDVRGLVAAPVWGLLRSAQSEHPGRLTLVDVDGDARSWKTLPAALASGESQLAIREGTALSPRLARTSVARPSTPPMSLVDPGQSVLITGGTGQLGGLLAGHLVREHGVGSLVLASRRGPEAQGASELECELTKLGARVEIVACDVSDREQLLQLIASIPEEHPLGAVVHSAGVLDDGVLDKLTPERVDRVLAPKLDAAWHLHELTKHLSLRSFVLFSSVAGTLGSPGQSNYAAANTFLDALAAHRQALGLPAVSVAWGWWETASEMTDHLREVDLARLRRAGFEAFSAAEGLQLFDAALSSARAVSVPLCLDDARIASAGSGELLPVMLRGLVAIPEEERAGPTGGELARRLAAIPTNEHSRFTLEVVCGEVATVLGYDSPTAIDPRLAFRDLGFDSLLAVELRNRINELTGLRLPATLVFDYPNSVALTGRLLSELSGARSQAAPIPTRRTATLEEPIAIVGMSCRYPGGASSPERLWALLAAGADAISPFPTDREWEVGRAFGSSLENGSGPSYTREGGFIYDVADFDAEFFGISPREAITMDPQQRLLLETSWEAFEDAGIPASRDGAQTGVFVGMNSQDYGARLLDTGNEAAEGYLISGNSASFLSGRLAYVFGLQGPAISVDTACSSSLVALHLACGALRGGECSLALAGGAAVMATPVGFTEFARQGGLAGDGRCKSFADSADGTNWGEGVGIVLLERLSDAQRLGHEVLAVVRSSAVNQDGASNGLTAPNGPSQERVIRQALANAGLSPHDVDAVEAHGTGTRLGDPIEAQALIEAYGRERHAQHPLWLGSIKSNIGHTQAAGGIAGVIKMTLALRHRQLPKTLHVDAPSSHVDWSAGGVALLSEARPWPQGERQRRAGISSFGISGTNVHLILEEAPRLDGERAIGYESSTDDGSAIEHEVGKERSVSGAQGQAHSSEVAGSPIVAWTLSGKGREALRAQAARLLELVESDEQLDPGDIGSSLARRIAFEDRAVVLGSDRSELLDGLAALVSGSAAPNVIEGPDETARGIVFMFTGQGAQRAGMGQELYEAIPAFREALDRVCTELDEHLREPLLEVLFAQSDTAQAERLDHTTFAQAGLFALEVALARLLEGWGVRPDYVIGHSIGELAAAHIAGVFSLADACRLVSARGRLMGELEEGGAMIAVQASEQEALASLVGMEGEVALAAVNGLSSVVLSGDEEAVLACAEVWSERGRKVKRLQVSHAFHSPRMDGMLEDFAEVARGVTYVPPRIPLVSNLTGRSASEELCSADYWVKHVRQTVRFADGIGWLGERGVSSFLEIGPGGVLSAMVADCPSREDREGRDGEEEEGKAPGRGRGGTTSRTADSARRALPVLSSGRPEVLCLTGALAELWTRGGTVDWHAMHARAGSRHVRLPTYPFRRRRYWMECASDVNSIERDLEGAEMALLDAAEHEDLDALALILQIEDERKRASLDDVMPSLSAWRRGSRERTIVDSWRYQVDWKPQTFEPVSVGARWLVVLQASHYEDPWLTGLLEALERQGVEVLAVVAETAGEMRGQLTAALRDVLEGLPEGQDVDCVLSLLALQEQPDPSHPSVPRGLAGTLAVVQALGDADVCAPLWMATRNAVSIGVQDRMTVSPVQAQSWGFGLTVGLENAQQRCGVVDLPHALDERVGGLLVDALMGARDEDQLAVRPAGVFVRRLAETLEAAQAGTAWIPPAGTILITGGTGGLGAHVARWLARAGAERLLLVSRRGAEAPGAEDLRIELSEMGVEVAICTCDVAESDQLAELIDAQGEENAPLSAVVHAAGIGFYGPIESMAVDDLERALGAKARGALNLAALTEHLDLSAFVLFSSIAGTLGSGQQGAYAAANACLDALALQLHARGLPAVSVAWGPWAGEGMVGAADGEAVEALRRRGLNCMLPELAIKALEQALLGDTPTVTVADIGWDVYAPLFCLARARPMIEDLPEVRSLSRENSSPHDRGAADELRRSLSETPAQERLQVLLGVVRTEVARVLAHPSAEAVDAKRAFADLGFDSLLAVELRNRLCAVTGLDLSATLVFDYPTPAAVADYLMDELTADSGDTSVSHALARLERTFGSLVDPDELTLARSRMTALLAKLDAIGQPARVGQQDEQTVAGLIDSASDEEIFGFIDEELGSGHSTDADASAANDHAGEAGETR